jgi:hypothetical protein
MWGGGSQGDLNYAEFQAKLLAGPPEYDPVEEHMKRVVRLTLGWFAFAAIVGGLVLWIWDPVSGAVAVAILALGAIGLVIRITRPRASGPGDRLPA